MRIVFEKPGGERVEVEGAKLWVLDAAGRPFMVAIEAQENHYIFAHSADKDFVQILIASNYKGQFPERFELVANPSGLIVPKRL
jgi:hypothetical protein